MLFGGKGLLIQPTPQNKPKSAVTIIHFVGPSFRVSIVFVLTFVLYVSPHNRRSRVSLGTSSRF